ncbi:hypothetical protein ABEB36_005231 [Hypothenemus hampei]|uniref:poly(ADP-ribose) glycohydrolase n=1 Tax=Hypothenemus hampei TaxID=57062 RepID=A0ABD1EXG8_HYPHA
MEERNSSSVQKDWKGTSFQDICKGKGPWSFSVSPINLTRYHFILYEFPVTLQKPPKPYKSKHVYLWDEDHVRMPFSENNLFSVNENNTDIIKERWKLITDTLSVPITTSEEFECALNKYNSRLPRFEALHHFLNEEMEDEESEIFFKLILPKIISLALKLPDLLPNGIPLLKKNQTRSLSLSQEQISCLLANAFLCTFPWKKTVASTYPGINFISLFSSFARPQRRKCISEKLKSICNYFRRVTSNVPTGVVTFQRKMIPKSRMPRWDTLDNNLGNTKVHISKSGTIEGNGLGCLQVDFANKNIGGGVLRYGCVQEEIRFVICPELIVGRLFVEQLEKGEAVVVTGVERYNDYSGYGDTFEWAGDYQDQTPYDDYRRRKTEICIIDAIRFNKPKEQFQCSLIIRELNKAYVGFHTRETGNLAPVATGNWGCGAFNGSKNLKTLIQLMACSASGRDLVYFTFGDENLQENFYNFYLFLGYNQITIAQLWNFLSTFKSTNYSEDKLYSFVQQAYFDSKKQPTIVQFFGKPEKTVKQNLPGPVASCSKEMFKSTSVDELMDVVVGQTDSDCSSDDLVQSSQPEDTPKVKAFTNSKTVRSSKNIADKLPKTDMSAIFDMLDGNESKEGTHLALAQCDTFAMIDQYSEDTQKEEKFLELGVQKGRETKINRESLSPVIYLTSKKKITDYFSKTNK